MSQEQVDKLASYVYTQQKHSLPTITDLRFNALYGYSSWDQNMIFGKDGKLIDTDCSLRDEKNVFQPELIEQYLAPQN